ncbi:Cof subfamily protein (haloacid dehalogenase superfamily) [Bacillus ectoiniformans]|uniref:Cof-type HAD-IIB family hydrolase n=1 Tax=Bacillus ectoiniformans TaxID=1494429 RepID=UPI0019594721|nr:Cof-type HAD-IIB family hydrolase [Bacillus ectoiniformans]MBM7647561.1 Cof subfamily protein (haloacid dehalogenase superfamily) [Bacillus ectoiniformans]
MFEKHLIVLDLDGTLLTDAKTISPRTKSTLTKAMEKGHEVMIATGRPYRSSEPYYRELGLNTPIVNFNGAFVHNPHSKSFGFHHEPMDIAAAKEVIEACHDFNFHNIIAEVLDDVYIHYHDEKLLDIFSMGDPAITTGDLRRFLSDHPTSMLIHANEEDVPSIRKHLSDVHAELIDHRRWGAPWHIIELVKTGLNKAVGIQKAAADLNIPKQRIIAFGDEDNDLEMIEYAGIGVAMDNGITQLKSIAAEITASNEEDGIAVFLEDRLGLK